MKTTAQRIRIEIEYLRALASMYEEASDARASQATREAIESLQSLLQVIEKSVKGGPESLPSAA